MSDSPSSPTLRTHRRQFFWQILLPVIVVAAFLIAAGVGIALSGAAHARLWADVAIIWMLLPLLILGLLLLAALIGLIWLLVRARRALPLWTGRVQQVSERARREIVRVADLAAEPALRLAGFLAALRRFFGRTSYE